jgi:ELWxxDGT repeat protein
MDDKLGKVVLIKDIHPGFYKRYGNNSDYQSTYFIVPDGSLNSLFEFKDKLYFTANDGVHGYELFVSDGTPEGTQLVTDLNPRESSYGYGYSSSPYNSAEFDDKLYFTADDGVHGEELFVSDGTAEGTQLVADLYPGADKYRSYSSYASNLTEFKDKLYFAANDGVHGQELFVSDGTGSGTQLMADLYPGVNKYGDIGSSNPGSFVEFKDKLYFTANDGVHGYELFISDGTAEGTQLVADLYSGEYGSSPGNFVEFKDKLYFTANDGVHGYELFISDGTPEGTQLVADLYSGKYDSSPGNFVEFKDKLYFTANNGVHGYELFVSDGTPEGTQLVADLYPGENSYGSINSSFATNLVEFNGKLYFTADDGVHGRELFVSDGTPEGTQLVADLYPGKTNNGTYSYSSSPEELTVVGNELFFSADISQTGRELFKLTFDNSSIDATPILISGSEDSDNLLGGDRAEEIQALNGNDTVVSCGGNDYIDGGDGSDRLISNTGLDNLIGGNGNDTLSSGNGNDTLWGGAGNDILRGRRGDDILTGGVDRDLLDGGVGNDILQGRGGDDIFVLKSGTGADRITDFNLSTELFGSASNDLLGLADGLQFEDLSFADHNILLGSEVLATLSWVDTEKLTSENFKKL